MTIDIQFASLMSMLIVGVYLGCMFDTNERLIQPIQDKVILTFVTQFLFWLGQSLVVFYGLIKVNGGQVRFYFILALILGFWFYCLSLRRFYQGVLEKIIRLCSRLLFVVQRVGYLMLIKPIVILSKWCLFLVTICLIAGLNVLLFLFKLIKWTLSPVLKFVPKNVKKYLVSFSEIYSKIGNRLAYRKKE